MNKKFVSTVLAVILGIATFVMVSSTVSLMFDAILSHDIADITSVSESMEKLLSYMRNSAIGVLIFSAATLASYCFTYFTKAKKIFGCISAGLSLALAVFCIAFVFDLRGIVLKIASETIYTAATSYFTELITLAIAALLLCVCFTIITVKEFKSKTAQIAMNEEIPETKEEENNEAN